MSYTILSSTGTQHSREFLPPRTKDTKVPFVYSSPQGDKLINRPQNRAIAKTKKGSKLTTSRRLSIESSRVVQTTASLSTSLRHP